MNGLIQEIDIFTNIFLLYELSLYKVSTKLLPQFNHF